MQYEEEEREYFGKHSKSGYSWKEIGLALIGVVLVVLAIDYFAFNGKYIINKMKRSTSSQLDVQSVGGAAEGGQAFGRMMRQFGKARRSGF